MAPLIRSEGDANMKKNLNLFAVGLTLGLGISMGSVYAANTSPATSVIAKPVKNGGTSIATFKFSTKQHPPDSIAAPQTIPSAGNVEVAFSPNGGITDMIVKEINAAKSSIEVQAYSFTSASIAKALINAAMRGVKVRVIVDKALLSNPYSIVTFLRNAKIQVHIDRAFKIADSKIMIIDRLNVITGSFNFTKSAEVNNAENCLILHGNKPLADIYEANLEWRWENTK